MVITKRNLAYYRNLSVNDFKEEVNEATVQFVGGGFGPPKTGDIACQAPRFQKSFVLENKSKPISDGNDPKYLSLGKEPITSRGSTFEFHGSGRFCPRNFHLMAQMPEVLILT
jgi:hypothetical protein